MLLDDTGRLCGLFTDSDLARLIERRRDEALDRPIAEVMTRDPIAIRAGTRVTEAIEVLHQHKISELPVVDDANRPLGLLDITDLIGWSAPSSGFGVRSSELAEYELDEPSKQSA
jgi:arabinose-5-phosphate isomerase